VYDFICSTFHNVLIKYGDNLYLLEEDLKAYYGLTWSDDSLYVLGRNGNRGEVLNVYDTNFCIIKTFRFDRKLNSHQIDIVFNRLLITDTDRNQILLLDLETDKIEEIEIGTIREDVNHINGLTVDSKKETIHVVCGNNVAGCAIKSEHLTYDFSFNLLSKEVGGWADHNFLDSHITNAGTGSIIYPDGQVVYYKGWIRGLDIYKNKLITSRSNIATRPMRENFLSGAVIVIDAQTKEVDNTFNILGVGQINDTYFISEEKIFWKKAIKSTNKLKDVTELLFKRSEEMRKLEIGSGNMPLPGYEHLDVDPSCPDLDFVCSMDEIPVEDNTFSEIVSIHSIEHIGWRDGLKTLKEWYRILAPGGKVHIACPNFRFIAEAYLENGQKWVDDFNRMNADQKNALEINGFHCHTLWANFKIFSSGKGGDEHMAMYDSFLLGHMLKAAGFTSIEVLEDGDSLIMEGYK
jgi:predicted SAM-dependent methyltransferase